MLSLNGVSAWVEADGKELEQYGVEEDLGRGRVTCWMATQTDKYFSVAFRDDATYRDHSLGSSLYLDGLPVGGRVLRLPNGTSSVQHRTIVQKDYMLSATSSRPFMFTKLELTDEDEYLSDASRHLGEIQIQIYRVQPLSESLFQPRSDVPGHGKVHERSKKAVTHCVSYGQEVRTAVQYTCAVDYLDGKTPLATFIFRYRDLGLLQANGIISKPPPAKKKATMNEDVLDLTIGDDVKSESADEDIENINNAIQRGMAVSPRRRDSGHESGARPAKRIKREKKSVPAGEVIDLT